MNNEECNYFDSCEAPLCPMDQNSLENGIWYPGEGICRVREFASLNWIQKQKEVNKKSSEDYYFSVPMLEKLDKIKKGVIGADPNNTKSEANWMKEN